MAHAKERYGTQHRFGRDHGKLVLAKTPRIHHHNLTPKKICVSKLARDNYNAKQATFDSIVEHMLENKKNAHKDNLFRRTCQPHQTPRRDEPRTSLVASLPLMLARTQQPPLNTNVAKRGNSVCAWILKPHVLLVNVNVFCRWIGVAEAVLGPHLRQERRKCWHRIAVVRTQGLN